jgi:hypothetical protein
MQLRPSAAAALQSARGNAETTGVPKRPSSARSWLAALAVCAGLPAGAADAAQFLLSTTADATLGGLSFRNGDIVAYDDVTGIATLFFSEDAFTSGDESIDSFQLLPNGHYVLSSGGTATLGGLSFRDGDAVDYDPVNDIATLIFSEDLFFSGANLDGVQLLPNGHLLISTVTSETVGGLGFDDGDIIDYDPVNDTATLFLDEDAVFSTGGDIGGFHLMDDGRIAFSTLDTETLAISGLTMRNGDLVVYDPSDGSAFLLFSEDAFGADQDVDTIFVLTLVPEPASASLLALGLVVLAQRRRRSR